MLDSIITVLKVINFASLGIISSGITHRTAAANVAIEVLDEVLGIQALGHELGTLLLELAQ